MAKGKFGDAQPLKEGSSVCRYCYCEVKQWVGLTDEEINSIDFPESGTATMRDFIRIIEAKLKDKNA